MATTKQELLEWVESLNEESTVAIDDGGLTLVEIDDRGLETGAYFEIGGVLDGL